MKETPVDTAIHLSLPKFVSNAKGFDLDLAICENLIGGLKKKNLPNVTGILNSWQLAMNVLKVLFIWSMEENMMFDPGFLGKFIICSKFVLLT